MNYWENLNLNNIFYINSNGVLCEEKWLDVPNCEGIYQASDLGRIKSLKRKYENNGRIAIRKEKIIRGYLCIQGYRSANLKFYKNINIHLIIAITFLNHKQCGYSAVVDHIDENKLNNCVNNLRVVTSRENTLRGHKNTSSKHTGVSLCNRNKKWQVIITIKFKQIFIGYYSDENYAKHVYNKAFEFSNNYQGNNKEFRNLIKNHV